jgi:5-enolpyruvylshikimate-3-phosphate synthase
MTSVIAALVFGGKWTIHDKDSIKTSFPSFLKIINDIKKKLIIISSVKRKFNQKYY